LYAELGGITII